MPLVTRYVEPKSVCAVPLLTEEATRAGDALQAVAVRSMAGVIRQLGSLARHAESVMGELAESLSSCHERTVRLEKRTRALATNVLPNLDPDREVQEGFEIPHPDLQFKSNKTMDQRLLSQRSAPPSLLEQYSKARAPPDLSAFDPDWDDGRNVSHVYSKPDFFFQSWREEIQRQTLQKMSEMDLLSPTHNVGRGKQKSSKRKPALENSTGSDRVSSFSRPVKRTFSLSRKPHPQRRSIYGSSHSLDVDPVYNTMPSYMGRPGIARKGSPSFHHHYTHGNRDVARSQSLRNKPRKRPKLHTLSTAMVSLYVEPDLTVKLPNTNLNSSGEYEYDARVKKNSSLRRSRSFQKSKSKSPIPAPSTNSVLDAMHMYTVTDEIARQESSPFALLSKHYLERLDLGSASFDTCLSIDPPKKEHTTFRTPIGLRQRPLSTLMRKDGTASSRASNLRLKQEMDAVVLARRQEYSAASNGSLFSEGGVVIRRRRVGMLGLEARQRPVSASFVDPPTVKKLKAAMRMSLRSHGGSLTDLTHPNTSPAQSPHPNMSPAQSPHPNTSPAQSPHPNTSPTQSPQPTMSPTQFPQPITNPTQFPQPTTSPAQSPQSQSPKIRPRRPAPQAPSRPPSRSGTPDSGRSTPKGYRTQSPLVTRHSHTNSSSTNSSSPRSSNETISGVGGIPNGRITPNSPVPKNNRVVPFQDHRIVSPTLIPGIHRNISSPQLPMIPIREEGQGTGQVLSPPQLPGIPHNISSPQLSMIPIKEEEMMTPFAAPRVVLPPPRVINGRVPPPPMIRRDSLYVSPRKQSLTIDVKRLRASQILQTGGITGGDLSSSRMDLLEAIRKGSQLKQVQKKEREEENLVSLPWDVAAILERRLALELDTDSSGDESNNTDWEDDD